MIIIIIIILYIIMIIILGVNVVPGSIIKEITKEADGTMTIHLENGKVHYSTVRATVRALLIRIMM